MSVQQLPPARRSGRRPSRVVTLLDLVAAIDEIADDERESLAVLRHVLATRRIERVEVP